MRVIMLIEDDPQHRRQITQWIETAIPDVTVSPFSHPREAEEALQGYKQIDTVKCIVLDMFFESRFMKGLQSLGEDILYRYPDIPIVLISDKPETRDYGQKDGVPLLRLEKPPDLLPAGNPAVELEVQEFRRVLIEAVKCGLLVGSLKGQVAQFTKRQGWRPVVATRTGLAALGFVAFVLAYATSILIRLPEFVQHLLLTVCAVTGVHLLDRAVLFRDFQDAFDSVSQKLDELSVEIHRSAQEDSDRSKGSSGGTVT